MADAVGINVVGLREFRRDLRRADKLLPKELAKAHGTVGQIVADEAIRRAPAGPHQGGGSITPIKRSVRAARRQSGAAVSVGGARSPQAAPTEFGGTLRRHASASRTAVRQRAYLYPAIAAKTDEVMRVYSLLVERIADEAFNE